MRYKPEDFETFAAMEVRSDHNNEKTDSNDGDIHEGHRNVHLTSLAGTMRRRAMSRQAIEAALLAENRLNCKPPLEDKEVLAISKSVSRYRPEPQKINRPEVLLFKTGTGVSLTDTARALGGIYANQARLFRRLRGANEFDKRYVYFSNGDGTLSILSPAKACSEFEQVADIRMRKKEKNKWKTYQAVLAETDAKRILESEAFMEQLPPIRIQTKCPVIVLDGSGGVRIVTGYDRATGILASGTEPPSVPLDEAKERLLTLCEEYDYVSPSDMSRYLAHIFTPGLKMGGICTFLTPMQYYEANASQSGKGFKTRKVAAFYNDKPHVINQKTRGVGSLEESTEQAILEGRIFILYDNMTPIKKGQPFHSDKLCSMLTEDLVEIRVPYKSTTWLPPSLHTFMLTTNGVTLSDDLGKRTSAVRIKKRHGFKFRKYPEGSVLDHIRANQPLYLGAVFAVINEWVRLGMPKTDVTAHDSSFTPWAQSLDWIVQNILGLAPLLDGFKETHRRITSPDLQWTSNCVVK